MYYNMVTSNALRRSESSLPASAAMVRTKGLPFAAVPKEGVPGRYGTSGKIHIA
jgi:hypothetical protein